MEPIVFMTSVPTFYMKGEISREGNFVKFKLPNTLFMVIPLGASSENIPITQISAVGVRSFFKLSYLLLGLLASFIGFAFLFELFILGLIILFAGVTLVLSAPQCYLVTDLTSGRVMTISFTVFDRAKAAQAESMINALISERIDDTNVRTHTDRAIDGNKEQTDRIIDAINNIKK